MHVAIASIPQDIIVTFDGQVCYRLLPGDEVVVRKSEAQAEIIKFEDKDYYQEQCDHASTRENIAAEAERTSVKYKLVEYMQEHLGEEYVGHISGITEWGMYVEVEPTHIEGMVSLRDIKTDFFEFEEQKYRLRGRRTHKVYRLGDEVRIRVSRANLEQRLLDFELLPEEN